VYCCAGVETHQAAMSRALQSIERLIPGTT